MKVRDMVVANECGGSGPHSTTKDVRILPAGGGANMILCHRCFDKEIEYRRDRNRFLGPDLRYDLPTWESLEVSKSVNTLDQAGGADRTKGKRVYKDVTSVLRALDGWLVVAQYSSRSGSGTIHTVESDSTGQLKGYRCTCMGYKIVSKKKMERGEVAFQSCTHTERAHSEGLK